MIKMLMTEIREFITWGVIGNASKPVAPAYKKVPYQKQRRSLALHVFVLPDLLT
jgi:hypothetical protein